MTVATDAPPATEAASANLTPFSRWPVIIGVVTVAVLMAAANRYGYHRDELYFLEAGRHLAWGYPDQPPLVPFVARVLSALAPHSLVLLRLPSALGAGATVVLTAAVSRELGGGRPAQVLAALCMAVSGLLLGADHYLNTSGFDLLAWTLLAWLMVRLLRTGATRLWPVIGLVTGVALLNSDLVAVFMASVVVGILIAGPRRILASPAVVVGGLIAAALWTPYLIWQAQHGWPQLAVSRAIAAGSSATSTPRPLLIPELFLILSPYLVPVWLAGLIRLLRHPSLSWARAMGVAFVVLAVAFEVTGGKSYYLASMLPVFLAAGAQPIIEWMGGQAAVRRRACLAGLVIATAINVLITLPVVPAGALHATPISTINSDPGETVAWPTYVSEIAAVYRRSGAGPTAIVTKNYGEAGAIDRFGPALGLPLAQSGQDGFWFWGPPPADSRGYVVVGYSARTLARSFAYCRPATVLDNHLGLVDHEQHTPVWQCIGLRGTWSARWPSFKELG